MRVTRRTGDAPNESYSPLNMHFEVQHRASLPTAFRPPAGLHAMQLSDDAAQDISCTGLQAPVEDDIKQTFEDGRRSPPHRRREIAEVATDSRQRVRRRGSPWCYTQAAVFSNAADRQGTAAEARGQLRGGPPLSVLIRGTTYRCTNADYATWVCAATVAV